MCFDDFSKTLSETIQSCGIKAIEFKEDIRKNYMVEGRGNYHLDFNTAYPVKLLYM